MTTENWACGSGAHDFGIHNHTLSSVRASAPWHPYAPISAVVNTFRSPHIGLTVTARGIFPGLGEEGAGGVLPKWMETQTHFQGEHAKVQSILVGKAALHLFETLQR